MFRSVVGQMARNKNVFTSPPKPPSALCRPVRTHPVYKYSVPSLRNDDVAGVAQRRCRRRLSTKTYRCIKMSAGGSSRVRRESERSGGGINRWHVFRGGDFFENVRRRSYGYDKRRVVYDGKNCSEYTSEYILISYESKCVYVYTISYAPNVKIKINKYTRRGRSCDVRINLVRYTIHYLSVTRVIRLHRTRSHYHETPKKQYLNLYNDRLDQ